MVRGLWTLALAPLFAMLNNDWAEIRPDTHRFVGEYWRPVVEPAQGIAIWLLLLEAMAHLLVIVNGNLTLFYWKLVAVHLGFISTFEVLFSVRLPAWLVPQFQNKAGACGLPGGAAAGPLG
ncbi:anoctamin-7-like isoform X2 [Vulpes lagopus]|uniref:anoctamin-7-like isoform X2 n=1 Tax=Vulpes lagopus TaxID=494514 RepID=UPI001BC9BD49|nr:anoctamin-7-like isoform X2 [Vulpes lagopus]